MAMSWRACRGYFASQFRCSHFWLVHNDWRPFAYTPWMPYWWRVQWLYAAYRYTLAFYFSVWLIYTAGNSVINGRTEQYLSSLTNWSFILWNLYLSVSAINVTVNQLCRCRPRKCCHSRSSHSCTCGQDKTTICDKASWLLFTVSAELAVAVCLLYWSLFNDNSFSSNSLTTDLHLHLLNGIVAILDLWVTGFPVHLLHFFYTFVCISSYAVFTGVSYARNSTATADTEQEEHLYPHLDYASSPGLAAGVVIGVTLGLFPLLHLFFVSQYLLRHWITSRFLQHKLLIYRKYSSEDGKAVVGRMDFFDDDNDGEMSEAGTSRVTRSTTVATEEDFDV